MSSFLSIHLLTFFTNFCLWEAKRTVTALRLVALAADNVNNTVNISAADVLIGGFHHYTHQRLCSRFTDKYASALAKLLRHSLDRSLNIAVLLGSLLSVTRIFSSTWGYIFKGSASSLIFFFFAIITSII